MNKGKWVIVYFILCMESRGLEEYLIYVHSTQGVFIVLFLLEFYYTSGLVLGSEAKNALL